MCIKKTLKLSMIILSSCGTNLSQNQIFSFSSSALAAGQNTYLARAEDYRGEPELLTRACPPGTHKCDQTYLANLIQKVRAQSPLSSTLKQNAINQKLAGVLSFILLDYKTNLTHQDLRLPFNLPSGKTASGNVLSNDSANGNWPLVYWLGDNGIYVVGALSQFVPSLGRLAHDAYLANWNADPVLSKMCPTSQSFYVVGVMPDNEQNALAPGTVDLRCQYPIASSHCEGSGSPTCGNYSMFSMQQSVNDQVQSVERGDVAGFARIDVGTLPKSSFVPVLGADHEQGPAQPSETTINPASARDLFKYGCLRQVMKGHLAIAQQMFAQGIDLWNSTDHGFVSTKAVPGTYDTRDLTFALMCANAIGYGGQAQFAGSLTNRRGQPVHRVSKSELENALWAAQGSDGGMWTNYAGSSYCGTKKCYPANVNSTTNQIPAMAKETEEITPLALLAYGRNIWVSAP